MVNLTLVSKFHVVELTTSIDKSTCERLFDHLDGLPLAIAQAGAYLQESGIDIATYLKRYEQRWEDLVSSLDDIDEPLEDYPERSIWTTWIISYDAIFAKDRHVAHLLLLWSYLNNKDIWFGMFQNASTNTLAAQALSKWTGRIALEESAFFNAMKLLRSFSLVEGMHDTDCFAMHAVVHKWAYSYHGKRWQSEFSALATLVTGLAVPDDPDISIAASRRLLPHALAYVEKVSDEVNDIVIAELKALASSAPKTIAELCKTDPLLVARRNLGSLFASQDKEDVAGKMYKRVLNTMMEARLDQFAVNIMNRQGNVYLKQYNLQEAETMYTRGLQAELSLGPEHPREFCILSNLGVVYRMQDRYMEEEKAFLEAIHGLETVDSNSQNLFRAMSSLATLYGIQGKLADAKQLQLRVLQGMEKAWGPIHRATLYAVEVLAYISQEQDDFESAEDLLNRARQGYEEVFGPDNSRTLGVEINLAFTYSNQEKVVQAEDMYRHALQGYEELFGSKSIYALIALRFLGRHQMEHGDLEAAEKNLSRAIKGFCTTLGDEHTTTLCAMNTMAGVYVKQSRTREAEALSYKILQGFEKVLGLNGMRTSSDALDAMKRLAHLYHDCCRYSEAKDMYEKALSGIEELKGAESQICAKLREALADVEVKMASNSKSS